jgi:hypothetical protein
MKDFIKAHQKYVSICRVLGNYADAFGDKPKALAAKDQLMNQTNELAELISRLLRPISTLQRPRQDSKQKLVSAVLQFIGMGIAIATELEDAPLIDILKVYKRKADKVSAYKLYEMAVHIAEELDKYPEICSEMGLTVEKMSSFRTLVDNFSGMLESTGISLTDRKAERNELKRLTTSCSRLIRLKIDAFVIYYEKEFPDLYKDYMLVRGSRKRRKKITTDTEPADISGTVTDSATGQPVANAVINLASPETIIYTDEDGYYLVEDLEAGEYTVNCHLEGYDVPASVTVTAAAGESLVVDFALVPAQQQQQSAA